MIYWRVESFGKTIGSGLPEGKQYLCITTINGEYGIQWVQEDSRQYMTKFEEPKLPQFIKDQIERRYPGKTYKIVEHIE